MNCITTDVAGVVIFEPRVFADSRGYFFESYLQREMDRYIGPVDFVQENESMSGRGVMRGFHFQRPPYAQAKLVRVVSGAVLDVAIDIRSGSPTYGKHVKVLLSDENHRSLFVPRGFAHGFAVLSEKAVFQYKCDNYYAPAHEGGISIRDTSLGISWPFDPDRAVLSEKDIRYPEFKDFVTPFYIN